jgi:hypothetical protein
MRSAVPASVPGAPVRAGAVRIRDIPIHPIHREARIHHSFVRAGRSGCAEMDASDGSDGRGQGASSLGYTPSTAEIRRPMRKRRGQRRTRPRQPLGTKKTDVMNSTDVGVFAWPGCGRAATGAAVPTTGCSRPGCQRRPWPAPGRARGHGARRKAALPR